MTSSKQIAKNLFDALKRGVDPLDLARALSDKMAKSSQKGQLKHVLFYLEEYAKRDKKENSFRVESATEIPPSTLKELQVAFGKNGELVEVQVNPSLIGGFRLRHGDVSYDATLKTRLGKLKEALI